MWKRFATRLRCPITGEALTLAPFSEETVPIAASYQRQAERAGIPVDAGFGTRVESGLLLAESGRVAYPIARGLPVMLPYETAIHRQFEQEHALELRRFRPRYAFPDLEPERGEHAVLRSFSKEWAGYRYDGVIWDVSYDDNQRRFIAEIGVETPALPSPAFLEIGCGIGLTTAQAHDHLKGDAIGVDLSLAVLSAVHNYRSNPFLHFVEASAFHMPFAAASFDVVYSRGVLHHTYSTREAFKSVARFTKPGGRFYLWVYGPGSINDTMFRRVAYAAEATLRPVLSRAPSAVGTAVLAPIALGYVGYNRLRRSADRTVQPFTFSRALHSARDRFTPRFAHRQAANEVVSWFREAGFEGIDVVDWMRIPSSDREDYRRNTGVRGDRAQAS
jgi:ubiquinone/menaquinone biosynthesis C-methylase UbiE/uncharacterized protein YbaR (Trm112 family)